ncbi:MAG: L-threonylcarbamoyladenylate synthase [Candidatus Komeilibacteria bacterium]|nr:L-threonylcarbamoyladenylate synthase [Candidatus Komeilibacteria bacterium]
MRILKLAKNNSAEIIKSAVKVLRAGGVIAYPTETAYGLGADFLNPVAIKKVYQIKGRLCKKPLSAIAADLKMAKKLVKFDEFSLALAKKYWPGPLTLIVGKIGLRISANKLAAGIVKKLGRPITATSANLTGQGEFYAAAKIIEQFHNKKQQPDLIIDAGSLPKNKVSTVARVIGDKIKILRRGKILPSRVIARSRATRQSRY